jgi:hypothetical protein
MIRLRTLLTLLGIACLLSGLLAACVGEAAKPKPLEPEGPALIMFYTDD